MREGKLQQRLIISCPIASSPHVLIRLQHHHIIFCISLHPICAHQTAVSSGFNSKVADYAALLRGWPNAHAKICLAKSALQKNDERWLNIKNGEARWFSCNALPPVSHFCFTHMYPTLRTVNVWTCPTFFGKRDSGDVRSQLVATWITLLLHTYLTPISLSHKVLDLILWQTLLCQACNILYFNVTITCIGVKEYRSCSQYPLLTKRRMLSAKQPFSNTLQTGKQLFDPIDFDCVCSQPWDVI